MEDNLPVGRSGWLRGPLLPRWHPLNVRAALWALLALRAARRRLPKDGLRTRAPAPPALPRGAGRGVHAVLRRQESTCLERALVLQRWLLAHGCRRDIVIGVRPGGDRLDAHAWLDFEAADPHVAAYRELTRIGAQ